MNTPSVDAVIGGEIQRVEAREIEANELNNNDMGDIVLNCNIRGFRTNVEHIREFLNGINHPERIKLIGLTESYDCGTKNNYLEDHVLLSKGRPSNPN